MRRLLLISLVPLVVACSGPTSPPSAPAAIGGPAGAVTAPQPEAQPVVSKPEAKPTAQSAAKPGPTPPRPAEAASKPASQPKPQSEAAVPAAPKASIGSPAENHGIAFGQPIKVGANLGAVLVTNTTDRVMSFNVKVEYRKGGVASAMTGTVSDLLPGTSRVANVNAYSLVPDAPEAITVSVAGVKGAAPTTPKGDIAKNITVSEPKKVESSTSVTVDVTNNNAKAHSISLDSVYMQGDQMVAFGEAQAAGLKPGETRTVTIRAISPVRPYDRVDVMASAI